VAVKKFTKTSSSRWDLSRDDVWKVGKNSLKYLSVGVILFLSQIQSGKSLEDAGQVFWYWGISSAIDLLTKFSQETTYYKKVK